MIDSTWSYLKYIVCLHKNTQLKTVQKQVQIVNGKQCTNCKVLINFTFKYLLKLYQEKS